MAATDEELLDRLLSARGGGGGGVSAGGASFQPVTFDWLGRIPAIYQNAQSQRARESTLSELAPTMNLGTPEGLEAVARRLYGNGDLAGAMQFQLRAKELRDIAARSLDQRLIAEAINKSRTPPETPVISGPQYPLPDQPAPAPAAKPAPYDFGPNPMIGVPPAAPATPGPGAALSPSDQVIAAAQQGMSPEQQLQVAQAGGGAPAGGLPSWFNPPALQARPPVPPAPAAPALPPSPSGPVSEDAINNQIKALEARQERLLATGSPRTSTAVHAVQSELQRLYGILSPKNPEIASYLYTRGQNKALGLPFESFDTYKARIASQKEVSSEARKIADTKAAEGDKSQQALNLMDQLQLIINDPRYSSGKGSEPYDSGVSFLTFARDKLRDLGIPFGRDPLDISTDLRAVATSIQNSITLARLGGHLGTQISNPDREFTHAIGSTANVTPGANRLIVEMNMAIAQHTVDVADKVNQYMIDNKGNENPSELRKYISGLEKNTEIFKDASGNLTPLGRKITGDLEALKGGTPAPTGAPAAKTPFFRGDEGATVYDQKSGKPIGVIQNGTYREFK